MLPSARRGRRKPSRRRSWPRNSHLPASAIAASDGESFPRPPRKEPRSAARTPSRTAALTPQSPSRLPAAFRPLLSDGPARLPAAARSRSASTAESPNFSPRSSVRRRHGAAELCYHLPGAGARSQRPEALGAAGGAEGLDPQRPAEPPSPDASRSRSSHSSPPLRPRGRSGPQPYGSALPSLPSP